MSFRDFGWNFWRPCRQHCFKTCVVFKLRKWLAATFNRQSYPEAGQICACPGKQFHTVSWGTSAKKKFELVKHTQCKRWQLFPLLLHSWIPSFLQKRKIRTAITMLQVTHERSDVQQRKSISKATERGLWNANESTGHIKVWGTQWSTS